jgi:hypothetical protein
MPPEDRSIPTPARIRLAGEIVSTYVRARWWLTRTDFESAVAKLRRVAEKPTATPNPRVLGIRLGRAINLTIGRLPGDSRCLTQSLVLSGLLARRGIESRLVLAVRPGEEFAAHAWVEYDGHPLLEPAGEGFGRLVEI